MNESPRRGFSLRIFMPDGEPDGLRIIEKSNWTGVGLVCPRASYKNAKSRAEFAKAGVYILSGPSELDGARRIYIGEGETIRPRLDQHVLNKEFWDSVTFFVSKDDNLNKAHAQYLESRLVELAVDAKRYDLDNSNVPKRPSLSEADIADAEAFLAEILLCLPVLGLDAFTWRRDSPADERELYLNGKDADGCGYETPSGFVVRAGARARVEEAPSIKSSEQLTRARLLSQGVLEVAGDRYELVQDFEFSSPSLAASVLLGRSSNGRVEWKDAAGRTLKAIQEAEIMGREVTGRET